MVFEAVVGLKEPYGSSNASIASYIEVRLHFLVDWINAIPSVLSAFDFSVSVGCLLELKFANLHLVLGYRFCCIYFTLLEGRTCRHTVFLRAMAGSSL